MLKHQFGRRLRQLRRHYKLTQNELAERINISDRHMRNLENGSYAPSFELIATIAQALKLPVSDLFTFPDETASHDTPDDDPA